MIARCDDTVYLANGLPGIVVGVSHHQLSVLWHNGRVTKILPRIVAYVERCPAGLTAPLLWSPA